MTSSRRQRMDATRRSSLLSAALAIALLLSVLPPTPARSAEDSNIPGIPLPGPVVTGRLGGPIYDRVFWIDVPADRVILLALSGDAGTDFDLYLFDSSATTIYRTEGQVAASTGPTSTESVTYSTRSGGRFYINLNGASDVEGEFRLTATLATDTTPPNAELRFNNGAPATRDSTLRVTVVATDDLSGVTEMQFSLDGQRWDDWREYQPLSLWSFPQIDGPRQLWTRVRDRSGNVSAVATATIVIDTVRPTVLSRSPAPDAEFTSLRPAFRVVFSERIAPSSWTSLGFVLQDPDGNAVAGRHAYDDATATGTFTPASDLAPGVAYLATLGAVTDLAGNEIASVGTWTVRPLRIHTLTLSTSHRSATYGSVITLRGEVDPPASGTIILERSVAGRPWQVLASVRPAPDGMVTVRTIANATTRYRLHTPASATDRESISDVASVVVRRRVAFAGLDSAVIRRIRAGTVVPLRAVVTPSMPDATVTMSIYRYDPGRRVYSLVATVRGRSAFGKAAFTWRPTAAGSYYLRLATSATDLLLAGISPTYRWVVT